MYNVPIANNNNNDNFLENDATINSSIRPVITQLEEKITLYFVFDFIIGI